MTPTRFALGLLAVVAGLATLFVATKDIHYRERNCGTALFTTDPTKLAVQSGDLEHDEFEEELYLSNCAQRVTARRLIAVAPLLVTVGAVVAGQRLRDRPPPTDLDIFERPGGSPPG